MDCVSPTFPPLLAEYDERLFAGVRILYHRAHGRVMQGPGLPRGPHRRTPGEQEGRPCSSLCSACRSLHPGLLAGRHGAHDVRVGRRWIRHELAGRESGRRVQFVQAMKYRTYRRSIRTLAGTPM